MPTHYFEPEIGDTSKVEGKISHKGDTCWFEVEYQHVMTKFQPGMAFKPFKYVVEIEGIESERTVEVKVSIATEYRVAENRGEWETVFSAVQEGR